MNVALGGTLYEDIPDQFVPSNGLKLQHKQTPDTPRSQTTHDVDLHAGSQVAGVVGGSSVKTNSMHHQAPRRIAYDLKAVGTARDGVVEAVEARENHPFYIGVQWHPEETVACDEPSRKLFGELVRHATAYAQQRRVAK